MIIKNDKTYEINSLYPNTNWYVDEDAYVIDETTVEGQQMANMYKDNYPFVDFKHDGEIVTKVIALDKPKKPEEIEGKRIELQQDEQGEWKYIYVDIPLTEEQQRILDLELAIAEILGGGV